MKAIIEKVLECLMAFLPFLSKRGKNKMEEMHTEIFSLKTKLVKELPRRCMRESCDKRQSENSVTAI